MKWIGAVPLSLLLTGCVVSPPDVSKGDEVKLPSEYVNLLEVLEYPAVASDFIKIRAGSQTLLTANTLADSLGVEFVEWNYALNPYDYTHKRNVLVDLHYKDPQRSFLKLFQGSGLLPYYDEKLNTVHIHPYSMGAKKVNQPTIFTPLFEQAQKHVEASIQSEKERLSKGWFKYFGYEGYTVKSTVNAWAQHAGYSSVIWFIQKPFQQQFLNSELVKDDFYVGAQPFDAIESFIDSEIERQKKGFELSVNYEADTNRLIIHPYRDDEQIKSFEIEATSVESNLERLAEFYGYDLEYLATDYRVPTPYITVLGDYLSTSLSVVLDGYPLKVEMIESTKIIKVRDK
ncbi:hypothetical protein [Vibrio owensii]|uniref:hypothetical protein n=1 Tax=Vibrio owensii TaxID=696485 RepID=UPI0018F1F702|nr:hypothetical protein [Vibrio owensii]